MPNNEGAQSRDAPVRDSMGRYVKGTNGCKHGGRKAMTPEFKAAVMSYALPALEVVKAVLLDETASHSDRLRAAQMIIERAYGKPESTVQMEARMLTQGDFVIDIIGGNDGNED